MSLKKQQSLIKKLIKKGTIMRVLFEIWEEPMR